MAERNTLDMAVQGDLDIASCANSVLANSSRDEHSGSGFPVRTADQANYAVTHELGDLIRLKANEHESSRNWLHGIWFP